MNFQQYRELAHHLAYCSSMYHNEGVQVIPDSEFDAKLHLLKNYEKENPNDIIGVSPTQVVGAVSDRKTYPHKNRMYSLDNAMDEAEAIAFCKDIANTWGEDVKFVLEPKYDGMAAQLTYVDGALREALKRGDGIEGESITQHAYCSNNVPDTIPTTDTVYVKGEFVVSENVFRQINAERVDEGLTPYANKRSCVAGILNRLIPTRDSTLINFMVYDLIVEGMPIKSHQEKMEYAKALGMPYGGGWAVGVEGIGRVIKTIAKERSTNIFDTDGIVIKVNSCAIQDLAGFTATVPRWAIAYKYEPLKEKAVLLGVSFQVGRTGEVCPVAKITPTPVGGVVISSVQLHNEEKLLSFNLHVGDEIEVFRSADCIPKFGEKLKTSEGECIGFTKVCPACNSKLIKEGAIHYCKNDKCSAKIVNSIAYAFSKECLNVEGFAEMTAQQFHEAGLVNEPWELYALKPADIEMVPGFTPYSAMKLWQAIQSTRTQPLWRFIVSLGIPDVGSVTARNIEHALRSTDKFFGLKTVADVLEYKIKDVGEATAKNIADFMNSEALASALLLSSYINIMVPANTMPVEGVVGKIFVFTGSFSKKRDELKEMVRDGHGHVSGSVSSKTDYLVVGDKPTASKVKEANNRDVKILNESEFLALFN